MPVCVSYSKGRLMVWGKDCVLEGQSLRKYFHWGAMMGAMAFNGIFI